MCHPLRFPPNHPNTAAALSNLAALYESTNRYRESEETYLRAIGITEHLSPRHPLHGTFLNNLAGLYVSRGNFVGAEPLYLDALEIVEQLGPNHPLVSKGLNNLAHLYIEIGRYEEAESLLARSLNIAEKQLGLEHPFTAETLSNLSSLYRLTGRTQLSFDFLRRTLVVQETVIANNFASGSDISKRDFLTTVASTTDSLIDFSFRDLPNDPKVTRLALSTIIQRKGRTLDFFTNIRTRLSGDPESVVLFENLRIAVNKLSNLLFSPPMDGSAESYQAQLELLQVDIRTFEEQLSQRSSEFSELTSSPNLEDIQQLLPAETALVEFIRYRNFDPRLIQPLRWGSYRYAAYILTSKGHVQGIDLGSAERIDSAVNDLSVNLSSPDTPLFQVQESAQILDALVMAPVRDVLGEIKTIFIAPDGALNLVPFETLVDESGNYLVQDYQFRYLTSGRDLKRLDSITASTAGAVLIGNPAYGQTVQDSTRAPSDVRNRIFPTLLETQTEVDLIAGKMDETGLEVARVYTQTNATEETVKQQARPSVLHIATHGLFEATQETINPLLKSGLVLAGVATGQSGLNQNGLLTALEVTGMDLQGTQLVVLSACETGLGELAAGEGLYGLRRAFVLAGAQTQVISLWKVADTATQKLMVDYYARLLSGTPRDAALRETQRAFLSSDEYSHPYYWAAFIGSGDWRPLQQ